MNPQDPHLPRGGAPPAEDAASQALAEALRSSFFIIKIIMAGLVLVFLGSGFFTVGPQEQAIKLHFGKPPAGPASQVLLGPGPHWAWPAPIDEVIKLHVTSLTNAESTIGWYQTPDERAKGAPKPAGSPSLNPANSSYVLSADTNIIHVVATAKYRITDPVQFYFGFSNAPVFITNALNNALIVVSSQMPVDAILTSDRALFHERVQQRVEELIKVENLGISVDQVDIVGSSPPLSLQNKFDEVGGAAQTRQEKILKAQGYASTTVNHATGEAAKLINVAETARTNMVAMIEAQASAFLTNRAQFESNPELFKRIKQMAVLERVYTNVNDKIVVPPNSRELRFQLNREPQEPTNNIPNKPY